MTARAPRVYLSGPISGYDIKERRSAFGVTTDRLVRRGYAVVNPLEVQTTRCHARDCGEYEGHSWDCWMRHDLAEMLTCDEVAYMSGSHNSRGARLERQVAESVGMPVKPVEDYLADGEATA